MEACERSVSYHQQFGSKHDPAQALVKRALSNYPGREIFRSANRQCQGRQQLSAPTHERVRPPLVRQRARMALGSDTQHHALHTQAFEQSLPLREDLIDGDAHGFGQCG